MAFNKAKSLLRYANLLSPNLKRNLSVSVICRQKAYNIPPNGNELQRPAGIASFCRLPVQKTTEGKIRPNHYDRIILIVKFLKRSFKKESNMTDRINWLKTLTILVTTVHLSSTQVWMWQLSVSHWIPRHPTARGPGSVPDKSEQNPR